MDALGLLTTLALLFQEPAVTKPEIHTITPSWQNHPEFTPNRIELHLLQGDWLLKRVKYQKAKADRLENCQTEYFSWENYKLLKLNISETIFCDWIRQEYGALDETDIGVTFILVVDNNRVKKSNPRAQDGKFKLKDNVVVLNGMYNPKHLKTAKYRNDRLMNELLQEIYSIDVPSVAMYTRRSQTQ